MSGRASILGLFVVAACSSVPADQPSPPAVERESPGLAATPPVSPPYSSDAPVLLEAPTRLEGGSVTLHEDGWLIAGGYGRHIELDDFPVEADVNDHQKSLVVLEVSPGTMGVLLTNPSVDSEDPPTRYRLYALPQTGETELVEVLDMYVGSYNHQELVFPGDGTARYLEDGWAACDRAGHPSTPVAIEEVWLAPDSTGQFAELERIAQEQTQDCSMLAG